MGLKGRDSLEDLFLQYPQLFEVLGQLLRRVDDLAVQFENLSLQFLGGFLSIAALCKVNPPDGILALLTHVCGESLLAVCARVVVILLPIGVQPFIKGDKLLEERVALTVRAGGVGQRERAQFPCFCSFLILEVSLHRKARSQNGFRT